MVYFKSNFFRGIKSSLFPFPRTKAVGPGISFGSIKISPAFPSLAFFRQFFELQIFFVIAAENNSRFAFPKMPANSKQFKIAWFWLFDIFQKTRAVFLNILCPSKYIRRPETDNILFSSFSASSICSFSRATLKCQAIFRGRPVLIFPFPFPAKLWPKADEEFFRQDPLFFDQFERPQFCDIGR